MENILKGYEPTKVWEFFKKITEIPRESGNEEGMRDYLLEFAKERGLEAFYDSYNNTVIKKPATKGYESVKTVILQGHLDMVCTKNADTVFDFNTDPLNLLVEDGWLTADGTTLGADNGIAIAFSLAILDATDLEHPAIEVVMTTDEEVGLTGALNMDGSKLEGEYFINLDSEEEGEFTVSCAGGLKASVEYPVEYDDILTDHRLLMAVKVSGLLGGHSGVDIAKNRGNGIRLLARVLNSVNSNMDYHLVDINGGGKDNVIPREAIACGLIFEEDEDQFNAIIERVTGEIKAELAVSDPGVTIEAFEVECESFINAMPREQTDTSIFLLNGLPNGIQAMSQEIPDFVETSLNMGTVKLKDDHVKFEFATRSSVPSKKAEMTKVLELFAKQTGSDIVVTAEYPGWNLNPDSPLRDKAIEVYEAVYGNKPIVKGIHAGLEAGVFLEKLNGADAISFGPDMESVHSPDEKLNIESTRRTYEFLVALLKGLK